MPYTVSEAYNRVLEEADKLGSDYFNKQQVLSVFKKETLDFVESKAKEAEINQEVTDDIRSLVISIGIPIIPNPDNALEKIAALPDNYLRRLSVNVLYNDSIRSRKPTIERFGESNTNAISPFKKADRMYPRIQQFSNYFNIITGLSSSSTVQPSKLLLIYFKKPTFGKNDSDLVVNLPDTVCEYLFVQTAASLGINSGGTNAALKYQSNQLFRKK